MDRNPTVTLGKCAVLFLCGLWPRGAAPSGSCPNVHRLLRFSSLTLQREWRASSASLGVIGHRQRFVWRRRAPLSIGRHSSFRYPCHFRVTCLRPPARESSCAPFAGYGLGTLASEFIRVITRLKNCKKCLDARSWFRAKKTLHMWSRLLPSISPQSLKPRLLPSISRPHRTTP